LEIWALMVMQGPLVCEVLALLSGSERRGMSRTIVAMNRYKRPMVAHGSFFNWVA
jgi:hypothetical protein